MNEAWEIETNERRLQHILAALWIMAGLGHRKTILRSMHRAVTRLLRPAEAAARRLIVMLARGITVALPLSRIARPKPDRVRCPTHWIPFVLAEPLPHFLDQSGQPPPFPAIFPARSDKEVSATRLASRLDALCHALDDLQAQAQRLARWQARRVRARARGVICTIQPLRLGLPLDLRGRAGLRLKDHELFGILEETHKSAWWAQNKPKDTS